MKQRIITAAIGLVIFLPCLIFSDTVALEIIFAFLGALAVFELIRCCRRSTNLWILIPSIVLALFMPFTVRQIETETSFPVLLLIVFVVYLLYVFTVSMFSKGRLPISDAALISMMTVYIITGFCGVIFVRSIPLIGGVVFWIIFISSWIPDSGAYFVGIKFGKHKLIPDVSPKKTVEGAVGGILTCVIVFIIYTLIANAVSEVKLNLLLMILAAIILSIASMIGDLIASHIKRTYKIKDYGNLLPGHGGVLDRFDSVLATSCIMFVLSMIPSFVVNLMK